MVFLSNYKKIKILPMYSYRKVFCGIKMLRTYAVAYMFFKKITDVKNWTDTDHEKYFICYKNKM